MSKKVSLRRMFRRLRPFFTSSLLRRKGNYSIVENNPALNVTDLPGGPERILFVVAKYLRWNREDGDDFPTVAVVDAAELAEKGDEARMLIAVEVEVLGPGKVTYHPEKPIQGTEGRTVVTMRTTAPLRLYHKSLAVHDTIIACL